MQNEFKNQEQSSLREQIIKLSLRTLLLSLCFAVVFVSLAAFLTPLNTMRIYNGLRKYELAMEYAESYINAREKKNGIFYLDETEFYAAIESGKRLPTDTEFIRAVEDAVFIADKLLNKSCNLYGYTLNRYNIFYAQKLERFTREFLFIDNISSYIFGVDAYSISSVSAAAQPAVYSHAQYMQTLNYRARVFMYGTQDGGLQSLAEMLSYLRGLLRVELVSQANLSHTFSAMEKTSITAEVMDCYTVYLEQMNTYMDYELARIGADKLEKITSQVQLQTLAPLNDREQDFSVFLIKHATAAQNAGYTIFYKEIKSAFPKFRDYAVEYASSDQMSSLRRLYWLKAQAGFADRMYAMSLLVNLNYNHSQYTEPVQKEMSTEPLAWYGLMHTDQSTELWAKYNQLLTQYVTTYA